MPCSYDTFPNIGTTHCYTAAGIFKFSSVPEVNFTGFARGCINCTGFNSPLLPFLVFINTWFVQSLEFVKKSLPSNFLNLDKVCNIEISSGKLFIFAEHHESSWKKLCSCVFFKGLYRSPIWEPWVWKKKSLFWKKSLGKVVSFTSKNLYEPCKQNKQLVWPLFRELSQLTTKADLSSIEWTI